MGPAAYAMPPVHARVRKPHSAPLVHEPVLRPSDLCLPFEELKSHLVAIECKVDEIVAKVDRSLGGTQRPLSQESKSTSPVAWQEEHCDNSVPSLRGRASPQDPAPAQVVRASSMERREQQKESIEALQHMLTEVASLDSIPGTVLDLDEDSNLGTSPEESVTTAPDSQGPAALPAKTVAWQDRTRSTAMRFRRSSTVTMSQMAQRANRLKSIFEMPEVSTHEVQEAQEQCAWKIVHGLPFQLFTGTIIVLNAFYIGLRSELRLKAELKGEPENPAMGYIEMAFFVFFGAELLIRFLSEKRLFYCGGPEWKWNVFDSFLVAFSIIDAIMNGLSEGGMANVTTARMVRIVRFVRIVRIARAVRAFHRLRIVVFAIFESFVSLMWCFVVVFMIIYVFAIFFMNGVQEFLGENGQSNPGSLDMLLKRYGSVAKAMVTLFMTISGGIDWKDAMSPLVAMHWAYEPVFNFYVFFMVIGVLNVVVGAFVATTAEISSKDREVLVKSEMKALNTYQRKIHTFFAEADKDKSGKLSWEEFKEHLEVPKVSAYFRALELDVSQAQTVFKLLDRDGGGEVSLDEFLAGCLRLKGQAKSLDLNVLIYEQRRMFSMLAQFIRLTTDMAVRGNEGNPHMSDDGLSDQVWRSQDSEN